LGDLRDQNERGMIAAKTAEKTEGILENLKKMNKLAK
jgi:hypothetical protein